MPKFCSSDSSPKQALLSIGYDKNELESIRESSILGVGCGAPLNFASLKVGKTVVDLGSGAGIDAFLAPKGMQELGKVIGIDFTDDMLRLNLLQKNMGSRMLNSEKETLRIRSLLKMIRWML
jgi:arsenite methyltransferase